MKLQKLVAALAVGRHLKLRPKLFIITALVFVGFAVVIGLSLMTLRQVKVGGEPYLQIKSYSDSMEIIAILKSDLNQVRAELAVLAGETDADRVELMVGEIGVLKETIDGNFAALSRLVTSESDRISVDDALATWQQFVDTAQNELIPAVRGGETERARQFLVGVQKKRYERFNEQISNLVDTYRLQIAELEKNIALLVRDKTMWTTATSVGLFLLILVLLMLLAQSISSRIITLKDFSLRLAQGDLMAAAPGASRALQKDEIADLERTVTVMAENLRGLVDKITDASLQVGTSANQITRSAKTIADSAHDESSAIEATASSIGQMAANSTQVAGSSRSLADDVENVASTIGEMAASIDEVNKNAVSMSSSVEETAATIETILKGIEQSSRTSAVMAESVVGTSSTIEEMIRTVQEVARRINEANTLSQDASARAEEGGKSVYRSIESLQSIGSNSEKTAIVIRNLEKRSEEIGSIVAVIEDIADQTNLLSLNASIQAAQAGQAGRGFGVVAEEIKKLAERSTNATKEIAQLIRRVQEETAQAVKATETTYEEGKIGMAQAAGTTAAFDGIISTFRQTSEIMQGIANSTQELSTSTAMVLKYVAEVNRATDEVNSQGQKMASSTTQMRDVMRSVKEAVFRVTVAVDQQAGGARQIAQVIETMSSRTQEVARAADEQKVGSGDIVKAMERLSHIAGENLQLSGELKNTADGTLAQVETLKQAVRGFITA